MNKKIAHLMGYFFSLNTLSHIPTDQELLRDITNII